ncbi:hypothetical protein SCHIN_v1c07910 [Spiroplasma chinense]|uniref:Uncharacterized protein n=1 Tax=Spiroplasma chinense TaxID=216932 RepID=A0A5B9Y5J1_9MOLU|nr:hypothetical protein [Spiroplasma chinense]QEH61986.1 hypothetical protein SCHIN_v1c07910 [Spiroplasma chinense]
MNYWFDLILKISGGVIFSSIVAFLIWNFWKKFRDIKYLRNKYTKMNQKLHNLKMSELNFESNNKFDISDIRTFNNKISEVVSFIQEIIDYDNILLKKDIQGKLTKLLKSYKKYLLRVKKDYPLFNLQTFDFLDNEGVLQTVKVKYRLELRWQNYPDLNYNKLENLEQFKKDISKLSYQDLFQKNSIFFIFWLSKSIYHNKITYSITIFKNIKLEFNFEYNKFISNESDINIIKDNTKKA